MNQSPPIFRLRCLVSKKSQYLLDMWYLTHRFLGFNIYCLSLRCTYHSESFDLSIVKSGRFTKTTESCFGYINSVKFGYSTNCIVPPISVLISTYAPNIIFISPLPHETKPLHPSRERKSNGHLSPLLLPCARHLRIFNNPPIQKLHNIKRRPNNPLILTQTISFRNRYVCLLQRMNNTVFAFYLMSRFGDQFSGRFLAHDIFLLVGGDEEVGWVRLAEAELSFR